MPTPDVTVVMITRDRRESALCSIGMLRELPERPEVIVVDNGSRDGTVEALAHRPGVRVLALGTNLGAAGRTVGVRAASTEYVAFADDDSWWAPGSLARAAQLLDAEPGTALLTGRTLIGPEQRDDPLNAMLATAPAVLGFLACASVVRRRAFLEVGGFHPRYGVGGEEQLLALDLATAGWRLRYVPELVVHHHPVADAGRPGRSARQRRNDLWTSWLRRSAATAARDTASLLRDALHDPTSREALRQSVAGLPWAMAGRRPVPRSLERTLRELERASPG